MSTETSCTSQHYPIEGFKGGAQFSSHYAMRRLSLKMIVTRGGPTEPFTGTNWGQQTETILITYMSLIRSLFVHAAPICFLNTSPFLIQNIQNSALRIATCCVKITSIDHLHEETKMLSVQDHLSLISSQYLAQYLTRTLQPNNPSCFGSN